MEMESEVKMQQSNKRKRDYYSPRTLKGDEDFLDALIEVLNRDKRCEDEQYKSYIFKTTMEKMEEDLRQKFPHFKPKSKAYIQWINERLRTLYGIVYDMLNQSGFGWDDEKKMIKVDSDEVWKEYVKRNPRVAYFRTTPIPLFHKLARVYGKDHASGKDPANPSASVEMVDKQEEEQNGPACGEEPANSSASVEMLDIQEEEQSDPASGKELANPSANVEMIDDKQEEEQNDPSKGQELAHPSANVVVIHKQEEEQNDSSRGTVKEPANSSDYVEIIDEQEEQNGHASGKEPANSSASVEMTDEQEEQNVHASDKEPANSSASVEMIDEQEEQNGHASGKVPANSSAYAEMIDEQEEQNGHASGKESANSSASVEMIDEQEEQNGHASGKESANSSASVEMIDEQEEQNGHASGKVPANSSASVEMIDEQEEQNGHASGKVPANSSASVEMLDIQEEEQTDNEEDEVEKTLLTPRKHGCMEGPSKKINGEENAIANSTFEFEKTIKGLLEKQIEELSAVVNRLHVDKDIYDDSRKVMTELTKMGLTEQEYFTAADRILSVPHRLHIFWGCNDVYRLAFVKWLIQKS